MSEIPVVSLDFRWQKQVESARKALERGNYEQTIALAAPVLQEYPACLAVRRLIRLAQVKLGPPKRGLLGRIVTALSRKPLELKTRENVAAQPLEVVASADRHLLADYTNESALMLLARAATELDWQETAIFAYECVREKNPDRQDMLFGLGHALLARGRAADAVTVANALLARQPNDAGAQELLRNASVALTVKRGNWDAGGDYRSKLENQQKAAALEQAAKKFAKPGKPTTPDA